MRTSGAGTPLARTRATSARPPARRIGFDENRLVVVDDAVVVVDMVVVVVGRIIVVVSSLRPRACLSRLSVARTDRPNERTNDGRTDGQERKPVCLSPVRADDSTSSCDVARTTRRRLGSRVPAADGAEVRVQSRDDWRVLFNVCIPRSVCRRSRIDRVNQSCSWVVPLRKKSRSSER